MPHRALFWEDVEEGQPLPPIAYELSPLRLVAFVRATGLYDYVHFDRDYARAVGARDAFIATPHVLGLFSRLMTDWSGPDGELRAITLRMNTQCCAGDLLSVTGRVGRKYVGPDGEHLIDIADLNIAHAHAAHAAQASATLELPTCGGGRLRAGRATALPEPSAQRPDLPDFARSLIGTVKDGEPEPARPLTEDEIHLWCECLEDWNPLYWDRAFACDSRHGGLVAPPAAIFHGAGSSVHAGIGYLRPGVQQPEAVHQGLTGLPLLQALRKEMLAHKTPFPVEGYPELAVTVARSDYFCPLRPGDSTRTTQQVLDCSPKKQTKLGEGYFLTWVRSVFNQRDELVRTFTLTGFNYHA